MTQESWTFVCSQMVFITCQQATRSEPATTEEDRSITAPF